MDYNDRDNRDNSLYVGSGRAIEPRNGGERFLKISFTRSDLDKLYDNLNADGWVSFALNRRREPSQSGATHYGKILLDNPNYRRDDRGGYDDRDRRGSYDNRNRRDDRGGYERRDDRRDDDRRYDRRDDDRDYGRDRRDAPRDDRGYDQRRAPASDGGFGGRDTRPPAPRADAPRSDAPRNASLPPAPRSDAPQEHRYPAQDARAPRNDAPPPSPDSEPDYVDPADYSVFPPAQ